MSDCRPRNERTQIGDKERGGVCAEEDEDEEEEEEEGNGKWNKGST